MVSLALTLVLTLVALAMAGLLLLLWEPKPTEFCVCWKGLVGAEKGALFFGEFCNGADAKGVVDVSGEAVYTGASTDAVYKCIVTCILLLVCDMRAELILILYYLFKNN